MASAPKSSRRGIAEQSIKQNKFLQSQAFVDLKQNPLSSQKNPTIEVCPKDNTSHCGFFLLFLFAIELKYYVIKWCLIILEILYGPN